MICAYTVNLHRIHYLCNSICVVNKLFRRTQTHGFATFLPFHQVPRLLLQESASRPPSLRAIQFLHALIITVGFEFDQPIFLSNNLITGYASLGELPTCRKVFDEMPERNSVSYNSIITAYVRNHLETKAWEIFIQMMSSGLRPTQFTFGSLLSSSSLNVLQGTQLHCLILKNGLLHGDDYSGTSLLGLLGRLGRLDEAMQLFEEMPSRNLVTWNSIIPSLGRHGFLEESVIMFRELLKENFSPSESSFVGVLSGFGGLASFETDTQIHGLVIKTGSKFHASVSSSLVNMYTQCSYIFLAEEVFRQMPVQDIVSWNTMITGFAKSFAPWKAFELFLIMPYHGFLQNHTTFASVISSCVNLQILEYGEFIHAKVIKNSFLSDAFVGSALIDLYARCDCLEYANLLFSEHLVNEVSWNALIVGHSKDSCASFSLLNQMLHEGYRPNEFSFSIVLKSAPPQGLQQLHCLILKMGYHQHDYISSSLIASYSNNNMLSHAPSFVPHSTHLLPTVSSNIIAGIYNRDGQYQDALKLLFQLENFDKVSWNTLIAAFVRSGDYKEALGAFNDMQSARILPDNCTAVSLLSISTKLCDLALGSTLHGKMIKMDFKNCDMFVCNVLVDMYAKCGSIESSLKVFNGMAERNLYSWTALISGLGLHGYPSMALQRFKEMESLGIKPDRVAFIAVLSACRHGGLVDEGMELFGMMKGSYNVAPEMDHYICILDLLTRYGRIKEAEELISGMPFQPNPVIWRIFLEGCRRYNNLEKAASKQEGSQSETSLMGSKTSSLKGLQLG